MEVQYIVTQNKWEISYDDFDVNVGLNNVDNFDDDCIGDDDDDDGIVGLEEKEELRSYGGCWEKERGDNC